MPTIQGPEATPEQVKKLEGLIQFSTPDDILDKLEENNIPIDTQVPALSEGKSIMLPLAAYAVRFAPRPQMVKTLADRSKEYGIKLDTPDTMAYIEGMESRVRSRPGQEQTADHLRRNTQVYQEALQDSVRANRFSVSRRIQNYLRKGNSEIIKSTLEQNPEFIHTKIHTSAVPGAAGQSMPLVMAAVMSSPHQDPELITFLTEKSIEAGIDLSKDQDELHRMVKHGRTDVILANAATYETAITRAPIQDFSQGPAAAVRRKDLPPSDEPTIGSISPLSTPKNDREAKHPGENPRRQR